MITLTEEEVRVLTHAIAAFEDLEMPGNARLVGEILRKARNKRQQISHQEGATKVLPPKQDYNQGCNAARYPYN